VTKKGDNKTEVGKRLRIYFALLDNSCHLALAMIMAFLVAVVSELSFVFGIVVGWLASALTVIAITAALGIRQLSTVRAFLLSTGRAFLQGTVCGLAAGTAGLGVAVVLGRRLSVPDRWIFWAVIMPPILGEFGHFLNRFSLRHTGKPDTGLFVPLGRLHAAAWAFFRRETYTLALEVFKENKPEDIPSLAIRKADRLLGRAILGALVGTIFGMCWVANVLHVFSIP
jgi:hypothetical protein